MEWQTTLNEYEKLVIRMNTPRVVIDNAVCPSATLVKVDSGRKHGFLLEAVQILSDLHLSINKAYISTDGRYFMDVFHVTDHNGNKLTDQNVLSYIQQSLGTGNGEVSSGGGGSLTALELTGTDRPGLLSEVFAVLEDLGYNVVEAKVWTHNGRIASIISLSKGGESNAEIVDCIEARLGYVLRDGARVAASTGANAAVHPERRLHQLMFADRDYEGLQSASSPPTANGSAKVTVQDWWERGYSVVNVECTDRPKLLFDIVCTLTDMDYVVFHGTIDTHSSRAHQEFYIRHADGTPISSEAEKQRVIQCLQAAIERRASEGLRLELRAPDRAGLLADVTRTFRENGMSVTRAEVSTVDDMAVNVFYVTDAAGYPVDTVTIEAVRQKIGLGSLKVKELPPVVYPTGAPTSEAVGGVSFFSLGNLVWRNLYNLGLIRSCS